MSDHLESEENKNHSIDEGLLYKKNSPDKLPPLKVVSARYRSPDGPKAAPTENSDIQVPPPSLVQIAEESKKTNQTLGSADQSLKKSELKDLFLGNFPSGQGKNKVKIEEHFWDYVIVLPNPDFEAKDQEVITVEEAEQFFKSCFKAKKQVSLHQQTLGFLNELNAFKSAFNELDSLDTGKKFKNGETFKKSEEGEFFRSSPVAKDFLSLMHNAILVKLVADLSLKVKQLLSTDGRYIYYIISADDEDLEKEAERTRYYKELELALTDLISLVPCDKAMRPLHMLKVSDPEIKRIFRTIKPLFSKALELTKNVDKISYKYDSVGVTEAHWQTYKRYLQLLSESVPKIQENLSIHKHQMLLLKIVIKNSLNKANSEAVKTARLHNLWDKLNIPSPFAPHAEYRRASATGEDELATLWKTHQLEESGKRSLFNNIERIRLISSYIYTLISLNSLEEKEIIVAHFPFHNNWLLTGKSTRFIENIEPDDKLLKGMLLDLKDRPLGNSLIDSWTTSLFFQKIPINRIRNYFGEKIALYFEFLCRLQVHLLFPGVVGLVVFIVQQSLYPEHIGVIVVNAFYCLFISIWATVYLEGWKRHESSLSVIWGQTQFEKVEVARPQFTGELRRSPITDDMEEVYFKQSKRYKYFCLAFVVTILIISLVIGAVAGLLILKSKDYFIYKSVDYANMVCSILNAIQIQLFNILYSKLVKVLTDLENHKTQNQFEDSLIIKTFVFQFVNSFNSLVYIAYIKCPVTNDPKGVCLEELYTQLISIFLVSYAKNLVELGLPYVKYLFNKWRNRRTGVALKDMEISDIRHDIEAQLPQDTYISLEQDGSIEDYLELAINFGYITLFSIAFPLSTTLLFIGLWFEMLTDKLKLLKLVRRPIPLATKDIGTWYSIFSFIAALSIISNAALFCFTAPTFANWKAADDYNYLIFVVIVAVLAIFRSQIMNWIPDEEEKYQIVLNRHEYIVEKYLRGAPCTKDVEDIEMYDTALYYGTVAR